MFKNLSVVNSKGEHLIHFGPMMLHGNSDMKSYNPYYGYLAGELHGALSDPVLGGDVEPGMRLSEKMNFPHSKQVSCVRHLNTNSVRYMTDKVGLDDKSRSKVTGAIFGKDGLSSVAGDVEFEQKLGEVETLFSEISQQYLDYFRKQVLPGLRMNQQAGPKYLNWTSNPPESANNMVKYAIDWEPQSVYNLIITLYELVKSQYKEIVRAIQGIGDLAVVHIGKPSFTYPQS